MNKPGIYPGDVVLIIAFILSIASIGYTFYKPSPVGPQGPQGEKGDSIIGPRGETGVQGQPGIGIRGANGTNGKNGVNGTNGRNGTDYVNHLPGINITSTTGGYQVHGNETEAVFTITVIIHDSDHDNVQTMIYGRNSPTATWVPVYTFFKTDLSITATQSYNTSAMMTQQWAVESLDGHGMNLSYASYSLEW